MKVVLATPPAEDPIGIDEAKAFLKVDFEDDDALILAQITAATEYAEGIQGRKFITQTWKYYLDEWPDGKDYIELPFPPLQSISSIKYTDYNLTQTTMGVTVVQATGSISITGTPIDGEHLTVGGQIFHFRAVRSIAGEITIDIDNTNQAHNIITALNLDIPSTVIATHLLGVATVIAVPIGSLGNSIILTTDATGIGVSGSGTLLGGISIDYVVDTNSEPGRIVLAYGVTWPTVTLHVASPIEITYVCGYGTPDDVPETTKNAIKLILDDLYENREVVIVGATVNRLDSIERLLQINRTFNL